METAVKFEPRDPAFATKVRASFANQAFMTLIGVEMEYLAPGKADLSCCKRADLTQQHGYFHAGVTASIADSAAGYAALSLFEVGAGVLTTEYKINLVAPGNGEKLIARGRVIRPGRTLTVCRSDVYSLDDDGETLIAAGLYTMIQVTGLNS